MKHILTLLLSCLFLTGCGFHAAPAETQPPVPTETEAILSTQAPATVPTEPADPIDTLLASMNLEEWVGQLFLVGADPDHIADRNLGGFLLFAGDFANETPGTSARDKIARWQEEAGIPLLIAADEEGGTVTRISRYPYYRSAPFPSPRTLYDEGGMDAVLAAEAEKCALLGSLGVNVNLAPVCDITTDPAAFMYKRSLGRGPKTTAEFAARMVFTMEEHRIGSALKHFPGYGNNTDTHTGVAVDSRSLEALETWDLIPFRSGIDAGAGAVLVSHTIVQALDPGLPASLSPAVHRYLREEMGFEGVILTDDLNMQAITDLYGDGEAAVMAVLAGNDLLCCTAYEAQYEAVLTAVREGRIPYDTLRAAVRNVLEWKMQLGLI